jgi:hypothetical protein
MIQQQQVVTTTITSGDAQPRNAMEDWVTGRGVWHSALFFLTALGSLFWLLYLVGLGNFSSKVCEWDETQCMGAFYWIPPFIFLFSAIGTVVLSRNESHEGMLFVCFIPFILMLNCILFVVIWFIGAVVAALVTPETCGGNQACVAAGDAAGLFSSMAVCMIFVSFALTVACCGRVMEVKRKYNTVVQQTVISSQQPVMMAQQQPMMAQQPMAQQQPMMAQQPMQQQPMQQQPMQQQPMQQQPMQPQSLEEGGSAVQSTAGGFFKDLNMFLPPKPVTYSYFLPPPVSE